MTSMAEVIAAELAQVRELSGGNATDAEAGEWIADSLDKAGYGHVPTALNEAADALERRPKTEEWLYAATVIRARAARAAETGGTE